MRYLVAGFPSGSTGAGLLLLRLVLAATVVADGVSSLSRSSLLSSSMSAVRPAVADVTRIVAGTFMTLGFITPVTHFVVALVQIATLARLLTSPSIVSGLYAQQTVALEAAIAVSLVLLGPGAYAIDARVFGRREIVIKPRHHE